MKALPILCLRMPCHDYEKKNPAWPIVSKKKKLFAFVIETLLGDHSYIIETKRNRGPRQQNTKLQVAQNVIRSSAKTLFHYPPRNRDGTVYHDLV